jgi:hypothetical protein
MRRQLFLFLLFSAFLYSCGNRPRNAVPDNFRTDIMLKTTPVKDRGMSAVGWCCAMLDVIETEHLMQGDSVNLSFDYVVRCYLRSQAEEFFRSKGTANITAEGIGAVVPQLLRRFGCLPYDSYSNIRPVNYNVLVRRLKLIADTEMAKKSDEEEFMKSIDSLLDSEIGYLPKTVYMFRAQYTPLEFARSVCGRDEYETITSDDSADFGSRVTISSKGKAINCTALNMSRDAVYNYIRRSIDARHPVMWSGDGAPCDAVALVGIGHDGSGNEFFVAKDSRGSNNATRGLVYIPVAYVKKHTAFAVVKRYL